VALGNVNATSGTMRIGTGDITSTVAQNGGTVLNVGTLTGNTTSSVNLNSTTNSIPTLGAFAVTGGDFTLVDSSALTVTGATSANNVTVTDSFAGSPAITVATGGSLAGTTGTR